MPRMSAFHPFPPLQLMSVFDAVRTVGNITRARIDELCNEDPLNSMSTIRSS